MAKIGRNAPCPCGSGKKYKKCHGGINHGEQPEAAPTPPKAITSALRRHHADEYIRQQQQGLGRPIVSTKFKDHQMVAVGDTLHYSKKWKFFTDFLGDYIRTTLGSDWGNAEIAKPFEQRHPILQWYDKVCRYQRSQPKNPDGTYSGSATGAIYCYFGLAYNLYLLKHNAELQKRLVDRLKNREQFQGAYFELIVANVLIRAGFKLELEDEQDQATKHCEFAAISQKTNKRYWVEVKMRSVEDVLGKTKADGSPQSSKPTSQISKHIREAFKKPAAGERLIFLDVNAPPDWGTETGRDNGIPAWVDAANRQLEDRERDLQEGQSAYVFISNFAYHRALDAEARGHAIMAYGLGIPDFGKLGSFRLREIWQRKQKHIDGHHILESARRYPQIPNTFDGSLPLTTEEMAARIVVGEKYFFENVGEKGVVAEVTSATVLEAEKKAYIGIHTEEGEGLIITRSMTDNELECYRAYSDSYFGEVPKGPRQANDVYELFEWFLSVYDKMLRDKLLNQVKGHPDYDEFSKLDTQSLRLEISEMFAASQAENFKKNN